LKINLDSQHLFRSKKQHLKFAMLKQQLF
jgi:hypothetical protein